ncbi:sodium-dependent glucose transporter 1 [Pelobates cultripes]|uniref:Sodium-dependent glucose transporter 1 n=1 Tax=Pelobates cultripes TaxID=61616 RepID=A0AAD1RFD1_PELCU|nr:sodium-dependent glucose transporter 1 [Pelobates cultripes]
MADGGKKKQVRFARAAEVEKAEEEEDTLFEKRPAGLRAADGMEPESERRRAMEDEVVLVGRKDRRGDRCVLGDLRCCVTTVMCAAFLGLGMAIAVLGPTFPDLAENVGSNVANISYIFVGRSCGYLGGSVLGGILFERVNQHLLIGVALLATAVGLYVVPWCRRAVLLTAVMSVVGMSMGFLDTGGNIVIMNTWGDQSGPHVQALHFSFALGAFVAPILAKVVLENLPLDSSALHSDSGISSQAKHSHDQSNMPLGIKKAMLSYIVIGTYILLVSLFLFILYAKSRPKQETEKASDEKTRTAKYHNALIFLLFLFFFSYVGAEVAYGSYIFTYATTFTSVNMDPDKAAGLNSVFWGVFAAVRGLAICFATCLYPGTMLLLSVIGCCVSTLCLVLFNTNQIVLWIGSALYGASMATTFPSGFSWVQQYTTISGKSASIFVVGAALGEMAIPASVGYLQGMFNDFPVLMYTTLISSTMTAVLFPVMYKLATSPRDQTRWNEVDSEDRKALLSSSGLEEEEEEEEEARHWNEADFEAVEMNDRSTSSSNEILEETLEVTLTMEINNQAHALEANGTETDLIANDSPSKMLLNSNREKKD